MWKTWPSSLSNDITSAEGLGFCLLSPSGHVFHTARETMIKSYNQSFFLVAISVWVLMTGGFPAQNTSNAQTVSISWHLHGPISGPLYIWRVLAYNIQIKICAEYRDMLPRPRLVCQEPGLRPIGRSPGVPDKSSRGLGSMSRYSAQILICFIAYIFSIFNFSVGLVGNLAELPPCTVPPATVHCYQNEAAQCSSDNQISQHALLRGSRKKHSLAFMPQNWWN